MSGPLGPPPRDGCGTSGQKIVAAYGHRLGKATGTGISVYVRELLPAIAAEAPGFGLRVHMCGSPEPKEDPPPDLDLPLFRPPGPRKLLHACWTEAGFPTVDRFVGRPDLVHVLYPSCPVPSRVPVVYTIHDLMPVTTPEWFTASERRMFERALRDATRRAVAVIADSKSVAEQVRDHFGIDEERLHVVPLGISGAFARPVSPEAVTATCLRHGVIPGAYAIAVGAVSVRKNPGPVIAAMASAGEVSLLMVGPPGAGADKVVADVEQRGLSSRVKMTGWLPRQELTALVAGAVALVHPSLDEGFGMTPLEAMAAGVPAIVSAAGALPDTVGDAAIIVSAGEPQQWADAVERVRADDELRTALVERGLRRAAQFTWARTARETIKVYMECLSSAGPDGG